MRTEAPASATKTPLTDAARFTNILTFKRADVAQPVEQLIRNQQVVGSNPIVGFRQPGFPSREAGFFYVRLLLRHTIDHFAARINT